MLFALTPAALGVVAISESMCEAAMAELNLR